MSIAPADGWFAVFNTEDTITLEPTSTFSYNPLIVWQEACTNEGCNSIVGYVALDRNGLPLPFPVAAPNVPGFLYYTNKP